MARTSNKGAPSGASNVISFPSTAAARLRIEARHCKTERGLDRWADRLATAHQRGDLDYDDYCGILAWGCMDFAMRRAAR